MRKKIIPGLIGFTTIMFTSCVKSDLASNPANTVVESAARKGPQTSTVSYSGSAAALDATLTTIQNGTVTSHQTLFANTGLLPILGGSLSATDAGVNLQDMVRGELLNASVTGADNQTLATSSVSGFSLNVGGYGITADYVSASATGICGSTTGSSQITNLLINGQPVVVTGAISQIIFFPTGGYVMMNGQTVSKGKSKIITVTGLRIVIPNTAEVNVATAKAEVKCS